MSFRSRGRRAAHAFWAVASLLLLGACTGNIDGGASLPSPPQALTCPGGRTPCGSECVDTNSDSRHCGSCGVPCGSPNVCANGACIASCAAGLQSCGNSCVDVSSDAAHCGSCEQQCATGLLCLGGSCACPAAETLCAGACVSTETSAQHCGSCGHACGDSEACLAGQCGGPFGDSCGDQLATGVSIREIAVYQAGKIPIMRDGAVLARGERPADVIQGKAARVRVFVDLGSGWAARVVSARLLLDNDGVASSHFSKLTLSESSAESSFATTFNFDVDPHDIAANTRYAVEIVECGGVPNGALGRPRFPDGDKVALEARATGILKLRFIPFITNGRTASTDPARLDAYRDYVAKMYPVTGVEYSVGEPLATSNPITRKAGWSEALDQLSARHEADAAPNDLYYYGLFEPTAKLGDFCGDGCIAGIGYQVDDPSEAARDQRVCFGLSYGEDGAQSSSSSAETLAHEVGHNHGRAHAPCGNPDQLDPDYPYAGAALGWWGFAPPDKLFDPAKSTDIMGYCDQQWVSDYTYRGLTARVAEINGAPLLRLSPTASRQHFRFLLLDSGGARWGIDRVAPRYPTGTAESAEVSDATGQVIATVTVYRTRTDQAGAAVLLVPDPAPGWYAIRVGGAAPLPFR